MAKYRITPSSKAIIQLPISIGHKAEKGVEAIEFDLTAWVETYGSGTLTVIMRRWGDAIPYPIALEIDENNKATWTLSDTDTAKAGMAYAQLSYIVGDTVVKKSDIYTFRVMDSLTGEGEPPEAYESWLEQLTHLAAEAMAEVLDIEGIVTDKTLTVDGGIADAKAIGDALSALEDQFTEETDQLKADLADVEDSMSQTITEDIYESLTFTSGYMGKNGRISTSSTLLYSNKISVDSGDVLFITANNASTFRFVTAFAGDNAVAESGAENVATYTVPDGITDVVVTIYTLSTNVKIEHAHSELINVVDTLAPIKDVLDNMKSDVQEDLNWNFGYFTSTTLTHWKKTAQKVVYFKCRPNTVYTIEKSVTTPTFEICYVKNELEYNVQQPVYNYVAPSTNIGTVEYTTGDDALYMLILCGQFADDTSILLFNITVTSEQFVIEDKVARSAVTYDDAYLPKNMYMVVGRDYEIYFDQICPNASNYTFKFNLGTMYDNRVRIKLSSVAESILKCTIYNADGTLAKELITRLHGVNVASNNVSLLPFGDSLTNHCVWESELMNMANNITCVGARSRTVKDSDNDDRVVYNEGRAGFTSFNYTSGSAYGTNASDSGGLESPNNRWYDPVGEKFSALYYFTNNFPSGQTQPNMMTFFLGMNDLLTSNTVDDIVANMQSMIDDILVYNSTIKIVLIAPQLRYLPTLNSDERLRFIEFAKKMEIMSSQYSNMVFLPLLIGMDSRNNYTMRTVTINTRSIKTEETASDITHPSKEGYWQIADYVLGAVSYLDSI